MCKQGIFMSKHPSPLRSTLLAWVPGEGDHQHATSAHGARGCSDLLLPREGMGQVERKARGALWNTLTFLLLFEPSIEFTFAECSSQRLVVCCS